MFSLALQILIHCLHQTSMNIKNKKGYTLIELLAVIIIIITVGSLIAGIIVLSLRGSNRSTNVNSIRQSGDFALFQMSKMIAYAQDFEGVAATGDVDQDGLINYTTECIDTNQNASYNFLKIKSFDQGETTYVCSGIDNSNPAQIASYSGSLNTYPIPGTDHTSVTSYLDTTSQNRLYSLDKCYFTCSQTNITVAPTIGIHFIISAKTNPNIEQNLIENKITIPFDITVGFKNSGN